jgi:hypothetical protein
MTERASAHVALGPPGESGIGGARKYDELRLDHILRTLRMLAKRISERFPGSGLSSVAGELCRVAEDTGAVVERVRRPRRIVRAAVTLAVTLIVVLAGALLLFLVNLPRDVAGIGGLLQTVESAAQDVIFLSIAIYFLLTLESRINRRISLHALHRLRSIVHIVDMHQLTKDPEHVLSRGMNTASSPVRQLTRFELARYLDYCTELLSLSSKVAALHVQYVNDPVVLSAVNDIETLAASLSNKIWQKIMILDTVALSASQATDMNV